MSNKSRYLGALIMILLLAFSVLGCNQSVQTPAQPSAQPAAQAAGTPAANSAAPAADSEAITQKSGKVYMLIGDAKVPRYPTYDFPAVKKALARFAPNVTFEMLDAEASLQKQLQQAETVATTGADAVIVVSVEPNNMGGVLNALHDAGILTMTIARDSRGGPLDYHVTMPFPDIAQANADYVENYMRENPKSSPYRVAFVGANRRSCRGHEITQTKRLEVP